MILGGLAGLWDEKHHGVITFEICLLLHLLIGKSREPDSETNALPLGPRGVWRVRKRACDRKWADD